MLRNPEVFSSLPSISARTLDGGKALDFTRGTHPLQTFDQTCWDKNDSGNSYTSLLLCFRQLFIVSNLTNTHYLANINGKHFSTHEAASAA